MEALPHCLVVAVNEARRAHLCSLAHSLGYEPVGVRLISHTYCYLRRPPAALIIQEGGAFLDGDPMRVVHEWPLLSRPMTVVIPEGRAVDHEYLRQLFADLEQRAKEFASRNPQQLSFDFEAEPEPVEECYRIAAE